MSEAKSEADVLFEKLRERDELFEKLRKRIEAPVYSDLKCVLRNMICPMCGGGAFVRGSGFFAHFVQDTPGTTQIGGKRLETVHLICANCGFVSQHAPRIFTATAVLPDLPKPDVQEEAMAARYREDMKRLEHFRELKDNWDSYKAPPLQEATITWAKSALVKIYMAELHPYLKHFCPSCAGAVDFEFEHGDRWGGLMIKAHVFELLLEDPPGQRGTDTRFDPCEANLGDIMGKLTAFFKTGEAKKP